MSKVTIYTLDSRNESSLIPYAQSYFNLIRNNDLFEMNTYYTILSITISPA